MKTTSRKYMDLRLPYLKLIIVMGVITWINDYQKIDEASLFLKLDESGEKWPALINRINNPDSVTCLFLIFQNNQANRATHEK